MSPVGLVFLPIPEQQQLNRKGMAKHFSWTSAAEKINTAMSSPINKHTVNNRILPTAQLLCVESVQYGGRLGLTTERTCSLTDPHTDGLRSQVWLAGTCRSRVEPSNVKFTSCCRQEIDIVPAGRGFLPVPEQIKLQQHQVGEGTRHQVEDTWPAEPYSAPKPAFRHNCHELNSGASNELPVVCSKTVSEVSSPINLIIPLGTSSNMGTVEEVLAVPERDTVLQVITAPAKLDAAIHNRSERKGQLGTC